MNQFLAILIDSYREAWARKALPVLLVLSGLVILVCAGISFRERSVDELLTTHLKDINEARLAAGFGGPRQVVTEVPFSLTDGGAATAGDGLTGTASVSRSVTVRVESASRLDEVLNFQRRARTGEIWRGRRGGDAGAETPPVLTATERASGLRQYLASRGWARVSVQPVGEDESTFRAAVESEDLRQVEGAQVIGIFFGLVKWDAVGSAADFVVGVQSALAGFLVGWVGVLVALFATASFVPNLLAKGSLDLVLARPIGRVPLLLLKYLGGLWFVAILATLTIGGSWVALGLGTGVFNPAFLLCIPLMVAVFSVIYAPVVLFGVLTRSGLVAAFLGLAVWFVSFVFTQLHHAVGDDGPLSGMNPVLESVIKGFYAVLPKSGDLKDQADVWLTKSLLSPEAASARLAMMPEVDWVFSIGTTAAFTAVMLGLASWRFARRDY